MSAGEEMPPETPEAREPKLLERVRARMRAKHLSLRTERSYLGWMRQYILFHGRRHPAEMGKVEINAFVTHLAVARRVSASTQTQALCALLYLYREVLGKQVGELEGLIRAKRRRRLPVVLTREEVQRVLAQMEGTERLFLTLLYGTGLRLMEGLRLRVKDVDFAENQITVRDGKGGKDRVTMLPLSIQEDLRRHLGEVERLHKKDLREGFGKVYLPYALARKYPSAASEWGWQYVFPAAGRSRDPRSGVERRHHLPEQSIQRSFRRAVQRARLAKAATCHSLRHSFATHILANGYDIRTVQELLHPCIEPWRPGSAEPAGPAVTDKRRGPIRSWKAQKPAWAFCCKSLTFRSEAVPLYASISAYDQLHKLPCPPQRGSLSAGAPAIQGS